MNHDDNYWLRRLTSPGLSRRRFISRGARVGTGAAALAIVGYSMQPRRAWALAFTGGPSVRVSPNAKLEIRWVADFIGNGKVELFDNPDGTGTPVASDVTPAAGNDHTIAFNVGGSVAANTKYHFKVMHKDPTGSFSDLTNPTPLPPVFTGVQTITDVLGAPEITSAQVSWDANVIGLGSVMFGTTTPDQGPVEDAFNIPNHAISLTGLTADTLYQFKVTNKHAIDMGSLAEATGQFRTQRDVSSLDLVLVQPHAEPRVLAPGDASTLSVRAQSQGNPVAGVVVSFVVQSSSQGSGTISGGANAQATTDANGIASVQLTAVARGNVHVEATAPNAHNAPQITVVVRRH